VIVPIKEDGIMVADWLVIYAVLFLAAVVVGAEVTTGRTASR
jgi:hypothetical protein